MLGGARLMLDECEIGLSHGVTCRLEWEMDAAPRLCPREVPHESVDEQRVGGTLRAHLREVGLDAADEAREGLAVGEPEPVVIEEADVAHAAGEWLVARSAESDAGSACPVARAGDSAPPMRLRAVQQLVARRRAPDLCRG
jgi:hypothetical protein